MTFNCATCGKNFKSSWKVKSNVRFCSRKCQKDEVARFWRSVDISNPNDCWIWNKRLNEKGYGYFYSSTRNKTELAHHAAYQILVGPVPDGLEVCHNCPGGDKRNCVNPSHLFLGTHSQNMQDAANKGTLKRGELSPVAVLNSEIVKRIKTLFKSGSRQVDIATELGLRYDTVNYVVHEKAWKHITI